VLMALGVIPAHKNDAERSSPASWQSADSKSPPFLGQLGGDTTSGGDDCLPNLIHTLGFRPGDERSA
jgi:hypothetical protein